MSKEEGKISKRFEAEMSNYSPLFRGAIIFILTILSFITLLSLAPVAHFFNHELTTLSTSLAGTFLNLLGFKPLIDGSIIQTGTFTAKIIAACTSLYPWVLFLAIVLAYPSHLRHKVIGLALALPALLAINQVRIVSLIYIGVHFPGHLETAHYLIWQSLMMFITVAFGLYWMNKVTRYEHA